MPQDLDLWVAATHEDVYASGGWAFARRVQGQVNGAAGGDRRSSLRRMILTALAEGLKDMPRQPTGAAAAPIILRAAPAGMVDILAILNGRAPAPEEDLDLWAPVLTAKGAHVLSLKPSAAGPDTPIAFLTAWAEFTREKAKARGRFRAVLPKPNLAGIVWS